MTMSFFGKLKSLHNGPPPPPRRTDNTNFSWPQEEFEEDEESDMYEAPPCERRVDKVPPRQVEEDVYLERTSGPSVPQRQAAPPPRLAKASKPPPRGDESHEPNTKKPPEINRTEKPGKKMAMPPPPARSEPGPPPPDSSEEDVYLDPNQEPEDSDDVYLEPTAACSPPPRAPVRMPPSPKTPFVPSPVPMMKPPVPRAKSNLVLPMNEVIKEVGRRSTFPSLPLPGPNIKPLKEAKYSASNPPVADTKPAGPSTGLRSTKQSGNEDKEWFAGDCNRKTAEDLLTRVNKDGAFLVRRSSAQTGRQPFTLAVLYQQKVYNIPVRFLEEAQVYALGKEGKKNEEIFPSLDEMILYHSNNQLLLIDSKSQAKHSAYLTHAVRP
ncbi:B-cell linker protein [Betta splendens]|uniref:B-cell linker protein n=1 Tax=Betta splendens TaxID=158456 RepID=A0A6P7NJ92_BETSP|nr:B-cell linker protein [Betta splendens]